MLVKEEIGQRIKHVRGDLKLTQQAFADKLEIGRVTIARYELGERTPDAEFLVAINNVFNIDIIWLLTGSGEASKQGSAGMTKQESMLLNNYRNSDDQGRAIVEAAVNAAAESKRKKPSKS